MPAKPPPPRFTDADIVRLTGLIEGWLADGASLDDVAANPGVPSRPTLRKLARAHPALAQAIARGQAARAARDPHAWFAPTADDFLIRVAAGEPVAQILRDPAMPQRRTLIAWKERHPEFAARYARAVANADRRRRRDRPRRARMPQDEAAEDRLLIALVRGATLPQIYADPSFPTRTGLRRWRKADPGFDRSVRTAAKRGQLARGRRRSAARCTPKLTRRIEHAIIAGHSLHSLAGGPHGYGRPAWCPSLFTLYKWVRDVPAFAAAIARASQFRDEYCWEAHGPQASVLKRLGQLNPYPGERPWKKPPWR